MHPNRSKRRDHSAEFKTQVLAECRQPGASVAAVAIAHGLNPNIVRKWLAGRNLKRMGAAMPTPAPCSAPVYVATDTGVELAMKFTIGAKFKLKRRVTTAE